MAATMQINQAGLAAGTPGVSREDGLDTGALVTLTSTGGGSTHRFELLWVPDEDTTAVDSLEATSGTVWTFSPTAEVYGTYRIRLVVDQGLPTESEQIRTFAILTPKFGLRIPALGERADPRANLTNAGGEAIAASETNAPDDEGPFASGNYGGWYGSLVKLYKSVEGGGGGAALWKWNEADVTQFDTTPWFASNMTGINSATLTLRASGELFPRIRVTVDSEFGADAWLFFRILDLPELPPRYRLIYRVAASDNDSNHRIGWWRHNDDDSDFWAYGLLYRMGATLQVQSGRSEAGTFTTVATTNNTAMEAHNTFEPSYGPHAEERHLIVPAGASSSPRFQLSQMPVGGNSSSNVPAVNVRTDLTVLGDPPAAGWTDMQTPGLGIAVRVVNATGPLVRRVEFAEMAILKHDFDL